MTDLAGFLLARLAEDEAAARAAREVIPVSEGWYRVVQFAVADPEFSQQYGRAFGHIARHDPARVLAEVAAKRRIVEECSDTLELNSGEAVNSEAVWLAEAILKALAQPYADHPDFDPAWKVEHDG